MPSYCAETMEKNTLFTVQRPANSMYCSVYIQYCTIWLTPICFIGGIFSTTASFLSLCQENRSNLKPKRQRLHLSDSSPRGLSLTAPRWKTPPLSYRSETESDSS